MVARCESPEDIDSQMEWAVSPHPRATIKAHHPSTQLPSSLRKPRLGLRFMYIQSQLFIHSSLVSRTFSYPNVYSLSSTTSLTVQRKPSIVNLAFSHKYDTLCTVNPT